MLHADLEDQDQTVVVPVIRTTAADRASGTKTMTLGKEIILVDTVNFTGLTPGEEYILKGSVMDKTTGEVLIQKKPDEPDIPPQILGIHPGNKGMYLIMLLAVSGLVGALLLILKKKQKSEVQPE